MEKVNVTINLSDLDQRTGEQAEQIHKVLEQIKPVQCELLGEETVRAISRGEAFESLEGGRHLNFMEIISILSGIATICQIAVLAILGLRKALKATNEEVKAESKKIVMEKIANHPELNDLSALIAKDPIILDAIITKLIDNPNKS